MPKQPKSFEEMMEETSRMMQKYSEMKKKIQSPQIVIESVEENGETDHSPYINFPICNN